MLSACMITQDEEECISRSIENIMGAVDEVIVLDGGSTDRTVQIAESYPKVRVFKHHFDPVGGDSFSEQRNRCRDYAGGGWIVVIDADEVYPQYVLQCFPRLMADEQHDAYAFIRKTFIDGYLANIYNHDYQIRLFKRYCKYEGQYHEGVTGHSNLRFCNLEIMHYKTSAWQQKDNERVWDMGQKPPDGWVKLNGVWTWQPEAETVEVSE